MTTTAHPSAEAGATVQPATAAAVYPLPYPESDDDPRFCFGLAYDIAEVIHHYGYPPLRGADLARLLQALFRFIYQREDTL